MDVWEEDAVSTTSMFSLILWSQCYYNLYFIDGKMINDRLSRLLDHLHSW